MKIKYLTDKGSGAINEDTYLITPNLYGIFDGATSLVKYTDSRGNTGGLLASQIAKKVFEKNQNKSLLSSIEEILTTIRNKMKSAKVSLNDKVGVWSTSASVIKINDQSIEYLRIGDSPILFVDRKGNLQTFFVDHDLDTLILWEKLAKEGVRNIRNDVRMQNQLTKNRKKANIDYGVLDGEKEAKNFVENGLIPREKIKYILIFSDGMLIPKKNPNDPENFKAIVELFEKGGLEKVKDYVRGLEDSDPECTKYFRFKKYDDLTAIAITL